MVDTSIRDTCSYEGEKSDWIVDTSIVVTIKLIETISMLDDITFFTGE